MSTRNTDRTFDEVGRDMARWLAENNPHATPMNDCLARDGMFDGVPAARLEEYLRDHVLAFTRGFVAGIEFWQAEQGRCEAAQSE